MTYDLTEGIYQEFTFPVSKLLKGTLVYSDVHSSTPVPRKTSGGSHKTGNEINYSLNNSYSMCMSFVGG